MAKAKAGRVAMQDLMKLVNKKAGRSVRSPRLLDWSQQANLTWQRRSQQTPKRVASLLYILILSQPSTQAFWRGQGATWGA